LLLLLLPSPRVLLLGLVGHWPGCSKPSAEPAWAHHACHTSLLLLRLLPHRPCRGPHATKPSSSPIAKCHVLLLLLLVGLHHVTLAHVTSNGPLPTVGRGTKAAAPTPTIGKLLLLLLGMGLGGLHPRPLATCKLLLLGMRVLLLVVLVWHGASRRGLGWWHTPGSPPTSCCCCCSS
jgi:hypothetical protein